MDKKYCIGCRDNFYNGNNDLGISECWRLNTAKLIKRKEVHISQFPPWNQKAKMFPDCYHRPLFAYVAADRKF